MAEKKKKTEQDRDSWKSFFENEQKNNKSRLNVIFNKKTTCSLN